jgi:hypothetical protein
MDARWPTSGVLAADRRREQRRVTAADHAAQIEAMTG